MLKSVTSFHSGFHVPLCSGCVLFRGTIRTVAPAGGICLSAEDMEKYLTFLVHTNVSRELKALKRSIDTSWSLGSNIWDTMEDASKSSPDYAFDYIADEYSLCWVRGVYKSMCIKLYYSTRVFFLTEILYNRRISVCQSRRQCVWL